MRKGQRHRQARAVARLQDVVQLILQMGVPVKRLEVFAELEVIGGDLGQLVTPGADALHTGPVKRVEQIKPRQVLAHIALWQPWPVQLEQRTGHAAARVEIQRGGLDRLEITESLEQGRGEPRLPDAIGHPGHLFEPLRRRKPVVFHFKHSLKELQGWLHTRSILEITR